MTDVLNAAGSLDLAAFEWLRSVQFPLLTQLMAGLSDVARAGIVWIALALLVAWFRPGRWPAAFQTCLAVLLTALLVESAAKPLFDRPRPFETHPEIQVLGYRSTTASMPSGHAAHAVAGAYALARVAPEARAIFWVFALLVGYSRIYLGVHYPGDVIAGALIGWLMAKFVVGGTVWRFRSS